MVQTQFTVTVENLAPENGNFLTPVWVGIHNGEFDTYDRGRPVSPGLESLAEDGDTALISTEFDLSGFGGAQATILDGGPIAPGDAVSETFTLESTTPTSRYFNYASMIIPSNDAFIANGNPLAHEIFDEAGNFIGANFIVAGSQVLDAGSEVNDESPTNTAFFGQESPNTGVTENGVVELHPGFNPVGSGGILDSERFSGADFTLPGYQVASFTISLDVLGTLSNDVLLGTEVAESVLGFAGNDVLLGLDGSDRVVGELGDDAVFGNRGNDRVFGGVGNDLVFGGQGNDRVFGEEGGDFLSGGVGDDQLSGGDGNDFLVAGFLDTLAAPATVELTEAQEVAETPVPDTAATGSVTATLVGTQLTVSGTFSNLTSALEVVGETDSQGNPASSVHIHFGAAGFNGPIVRNLTVTDNGDNSGTISGTFELNASEVAAVVAGTSYFNLHTANNPSGELRGQLPIAPAADSGSNLLNGDGDNDVLIGGTGNDTIDGGTGSDTLTGFTGNDTFVVAAGNGTDLILDFEDGVDAIGLAGGLTFADLTIVQGTSEDPTSLESQNHALIRVASSNELLASVAFTSVSAIDTSDFTTIE